MAAERGTSGLLTPDMVVQKIIQLGRPTTTPELTLALRKLVHSAFFERGKRYFNTNQFYVMLGADDVRPLFPSTDLLELYLKDGALERFKMPYVTGCTFYKEVTGYELHFTFDIPPEHVRASLCLVQESTRACDASRT